MMSRLSIKHSHVTYTVKYSAVFPDVRHVLCSLTFVVSNARACLFCHCWLRTVSTGQNAFNFIWSLIASITTKIMFATDTANDT